VRIPDSKTIRRAIILASAVVFLGALVATSYVTVTLPGCVACHSKGTFGTATAAARHTDVACTSCHVSSSLTGRIAFGLQETFHMVVPIVSGDGREWAKVPDGRCLTCHDDVESKVVTAGGIKIAHSTCDVDAACTDCHSATAHGAATTWVRTYDMNTCLRCHVTEASTACDLCHTEGRRPADRVTAGVFATTHGPQWQKTHGMGDSATCIVCHTAATCAKCHGPGLPHEAKFIKTHPEYALAPTAKCDGCHEKRFCDDCHGLDMPHTASFTAKHAAASEDKALCDRCHAASDCTVCHVKHIHPGGAVGNFPNRPQGGGQ
jgi:hypothetical protein